MSQFTATFRLESEKKNASDVGSSDMFQPVAKGWTSQTCFNCSKPGHKRAQNKVPVICGREDHETEKFLAPSEISPDQYRMT